MDEFIRKDNDLFNNYSVGLDNNNQVIYNIKSFFDKSVVDGRL